MKVAIVHDYLTQRGGAEKAALALSETFWSAPIFTSVYSPSETLKEFALRDVRVTFLNAWYHLLRNHRLLLPLYPRAFNGIALEGFDVIIASSSAFAHHVRKPPGALLVCYCHNPARFLWMRDIYLAQERMSTAKRLYLGFFYDSLKRRDLRAVDSVDLFIANSATVKERIHRYYQREASVVYPPVDCGAFNVSRRNDGYFLIVSRLLAHKRIDIAIRAFGGLGMKLKIVGTGPHYSALKGMSRPNVEFVGGVGDAELKGIYAGCAALIYPQSEDFGIAPLEANASGKPVIAFGEGGALETMVPYNASTRDGTALFFYRQTPEDLAAAVQRFEGCVFDPQRLRENALRFDKPIFITAMRTTIEGLLRKASP